MDINDQLEVELLVKKCQEEAPYGMRAFEALVNAFEPSVYRLCLNYIKNSADAEDLVQTIFLRVFHNIKNFKGDSSFKTWLYRVSINQCNDLYKKKKRQKELREGLQTEEVQTSSPPEADNLELREQIEQGLEKLSPQEREVIVLRFYEGFKIQEIAETLGIQLSAAKMRLSRAIEHFKILYDP